MDNENRLILTILIQTHGKIISFDLDAKTSAMFENVRLFCKAGDFVDYQSNLAEEFTLVGNLQKYFTKDIESTLYDILQSSETGILLDNVNFDKSLSITLGEPNWTDAWNPATYLQGIYLLSIHQRGKLVYPLDPKEKPINFMVLKDLHKLASVFHTQVPNLADLSTPFPKQSMYIDEETRIQETPSFSEKEKEEKTQQIREQFFVALDHWQLTLQKNHEKITSIKLSTLMELVKTIIGNPCYIQLLDYSCHSSSAYKPKHRKGPGTMIRAPPTKKHHWGGGGEGEGGNRQKIKKRGQNKKQQTTKKRNRKKIKRISNKKENHPS
jgi:hypothetical protein